MFKVQVKINGVWTDYVSQVYDTKESAVALGEISCLPYRVLVKVGN